MTEIRAQHFLEAFEQIAEQHPDNAAVLTDGKSPVAYREIKQRALVIANELRAAGAGPETIVGLHIEKSSEYLAGVLGCWYAGAAFMPLDPNLPEERRDFILEDSGAQVIFSTKENSSQVSGSGRFVIDIEDIDFEGQADAPEIKHDLKSPAYVIYTSGSTGTPKGVEVTHEGLVPMLEAQVEAFELGPESRSLFYLSTNFDASVSDIGTALLSGAALCIETRPVQEIAANLTEVVRERGITYMDIPPSVLRIIDPETMPDTLHSITIGGETLDPDIVRNWAEKFRLVNVYGPTEATVCTSLVVCDPETWSVPTIGSPISGVSYKIVGPDMEEVVPGESGELLIGGSQLARGYLNKPELNQEKFIDIGGKRFYRSGDKVKAGSDNQPIFLGRIDRQVKIRGQLVELEEVEASILKDPAIAKTAVLKRPLGTSGSDREALVAFITGDSVVDPNRIKKALSVSLPAWMVPSHIEHLPEMPETATGKINYDVLEKRRIHISGHTQDRPLTALESQILDIWKRVLKNGDIGVEDNFHDIGGDSLSLIEISMAAEAEGLPITPNLVYENPTVAELSAWLGEHPDVSADHATSASMSADELRADVALDEEWQRLIREAQDLPETEKDKPGDIFLTGATGFLASRLMHELLSNSNARVHALVRASDPDSGLRRIEKALNSHGLKLTSAMRERIIPICGDLSEPRMGMSAEQWEQVSQETDTVIHCGAVVNMTAPYESLSGANIDGTKEAVRLALTGRRKKFHYASTLSVFVSTDQNEGDLLEADKLAKTQTVYGGYGQTKWAAEHFLHQIPADVLDASVFRLGLITGDTLSGRCSPKDFLHMFVRGITGLGGAPEGDASAIEVDVTPVDYCSEAMRHIILNNNGSQIADDGHTVFHIANQRGFSLEQILNAIRWRGHQIDTLPPHIWQEKMEGMRAAGFTVEESAAYFAMVRMLPDETVIGRHTAMDLFQATGVTFDQRNTQAALAGSRIVLPPPDTDLLDTYIDSITGRKKEISKRGGMKMAKTKTGLVLGKFLPPHKGHAYLIDFARRYPGVSKLYVVVDRIKDEPIPQALRVQWLQAMFPDVTVLPLGDYNWQSPEEAPAPEAFWKQWERSLKAAIPEGVDFCFNSEQYGWKLAEVLGAKHVPVDRGRDNFPISGTNVRKDPFSHWEYLPREVRPYFTKRVAIVGAESTGKSILAQRLAAHFNTVAVPEYARVFLEALAEKDEPRCTEYGDIERFAEGQVASEMALMPKANRILISDTDPLTTQIWSATLYPQKPVPPSVAELADEVDYDLYLLAGADVPWVPDSHRQWEDESKQGRRRAFEHRIKAELLARGKPFVEITGDDFDDRFEQAKRAISERIFKGRSFPDFGVNEP